MSELREPKARIQNNLADLARPAADRRISDDMRAFIVDRIYRMRDRRGRVEVESLGEISPRELSTRRTIVTVVVASIISALVSGALAWNFGGSHRTKRALRIPSASVASVGSSPAAGSATSPPTLALGVLPIITVPVSSSTTTTISVIVHAAGAVRSPGVFVFHEPARIDDVITAAGGLADEADQAGLNLAAPVADGQRVFVPQRGQEIPTVLPVEIAAPVDSGPGGLAGSGPASAKSARGVASAGGATIVNLNTATAEELDSLPGVGPATAAAILAYRSEKGRFRSVSELMEVRGIGEAKFASMRSRVAV